jgi:hypothetical protein
MTSPRTDLRPTEPLATGGLRPAATISTGSAGAGAVAQTTRQLDVGPPVFPQEGKSWRTARSGASADAQARTPGTRGVRRSEPRLRLLGRGGAVGPGPSSSDVPPIARCVRPCWPAWDRCTRGGWTRGAWWPRYSDSASMLSPAPRGTRRSGGGARACRPARSGS